jgi:hypothetical protein
MLKKITAIVVIALFIFSCSNSSLFNSTEETVSADSQITSAENSIIQLVEAESYTHTRYGIPQYQREFLVKVKNIAYQKHITVYSEMDSGNWVEICALEYKESIPGGYELWTALLSTYTNTWGDEFVIRFLADDVEYWDNNNGQNYTYSGATGPMFAEPYTILQENGTINGNWLNIGVDLRNIAYEKSVNIIYTTNNWATTNVQSAYYTSSYTYGYSGISSPNAYGIERWRASIDIGYDSGETVEYVISYDVNGQTYWDNNWGRNYSITR